MTDQRKDIDERDGLGWRGAIRSVSMRLNLYEQLNDKVN